jgi:hypothetical protein
LTIATRPVTNREYEQFRPAHRRAQGADARFAADDSPAVMVSWHDAVAYCNWFSEETGEVVRLPTEAEHKHDPALAYCDNGDLLAIWYTTRTEQGGELGIAGARFRQSTQQWDEADLFWDVADRNDHAPALWNDGQGTLYHFNGLGVAEGWRELALILRTSTDNGATWSPARLINASHGLRNMPIPGVFSDAEGRIYLPCDAVPGMEGGTALHASDDGGRTWTDLGACQPAPTFQAGATGHWIAGIHAAVAEAGDGRLIAVGRGNSIDQCMPFSVSRDRGKTWSYSATPFSRLEADSAPS